MHPAFVPLSKAFIGCDYKGNTQQLQESGLCNLEVAVLRASIEECPQSANDPDVGICPLPIRLHWKVKQEGRSGSWIWVKQTKKTHVVCCVCVCVGLSCVVWDSTFTTGCPHLPEVFRIISLWQKYLYSHCGRHNSADSILFVYVSLTFSIDSLNCSLKPALATFVDSSHFWILCPSAHLKPHQSWWSFLLHMLPFSFNELKMHLVKSAFYSKDFTSCRILIVLHWQL